MFDTSEKERNVMARMKEQTEEIKLPEAFLKRMEILLGEEYEDFLEKIQEERTYGLRWNPMKIGEKEASVLAGKMGLEKVPWAREGYYYKNEMRPGKHVFHDAGVFYIQEPSAMAAVELLDPVPGDKVLDLCAAPGGKTTQIAGLLSGKGFLLSNECYPARAKILSQNVERMGIPNVVVTSEEPAKLSERFPCFFDKILVDAPCSGEGMFRKDPEARAQWSLEQVAMCAERQKEILDCAGKMLRPGGRMVYSTCTFSPEENEGSIQGFLERNSEFSVEKTSGCPGFDRGRPEWIGDLGRELEHTIRLWPHQIKGEGHYIAVLKKDENALDYGKKREKMPSYVRDNQIIKLWRKFQQETLTAQGIALFGQEAESYMVLFGEQLYWIPEEMPDYKGIRVLRAGLHLGTLKKNRFEPSHGLALYLKKEHVKRWESREPNSQDIERYLRGEMLTVSKQQNAEILEPVVWNVSKYPDIEGVPDSKKIKGQKRKEQKEGKDNGWLLMLADGYSIGWVRQVGEVLKNYYPKGLRHNGSHF